MACLIAYVEIPILCLLLLVDPSQVCERLRFGKNELEKAAEKRTLNILIDAVC